MEEKNVNFCSRKLNSTLLSFNVDSYFAVSVENKCKVQIHSKHVCDMIQ